MSRRAILNSQDTIRPKFIIPLKSHKLFLGERTHIMGIVNATPDSFSHDGIFQGIKGQTQKGIDRAILQAQKLIREGADIIDVGGESTRPGAKPISIREELNRVIPVIERLAKKIKVPISVDTYKPDVAQQALDAGASIVNNIMGTQANKILLKMIKNYEAAVVLMHTSGTPQTMQRKTKYNNLIKNIIDSLRKSIENCLEIGIKSDKIIVDPGIGFGKTAEQNLEIIGELNHFKILRRPLLMGTSRKSFIGKILNQDVEERLIGTIASVCASILKGAHIVRVHDVKAVKEAVTMTDAMMMKK